MSDSGSSGGGGKRGEARAAAAAAAAAAAGAPRPPRPTPPPSATSAMSLGGGSSSSGGGGSGGGVGVGGAGATPPRSPVQKRRPVTSALTQSLLNADLRAERRVFGAAGADAATSMPQVSTMKAKSNVSQYDFVKVRVWLRDHYYVLSRFLISRILRVIKLPSESSIKIALELKKKLVETQQLDIKQRDLERLLFELILRSGYTQKHVDRFRTIVRFHHERIPLVILISGTGCVGKSTLATQLAERLNISVVLQTDSIYELMAHFDTALDRRPIFERPFESAEKTRREFRDECVRIRRGLDTDIRKALQEGKALIVEGMHLDFKLYAEFFESAVAQRAVVLPFLFVLNEADNRSLLAEWIKSSCYPNKALLGANLAQQADALFSHYRAIQDELLEYAIERTPIDVLQPEATLDMLHNKVLDCMMDAVYALPDSVDD